MDKAQILIKAGNNWFEFYKSKTGQLDYEGLYDCIDLSDVDGYQEIASSAYFSPSWYIYLDNKVNCNPKIYTAPGVDVSDKDVFAFLAHVGPLLAAVEAKDSLLAGELYLRRKKCFDKFAQLTQYIMEPLCAEILFSLAYGRLCNTDMDEISIIFDSAKKKLGYDPAKETLDQAFMRFFKENTVSLTLPAVGTAHHRWDCYSNQLEHLADNLSAEDLCGNARKIREAKHKFYAELETAVQAMPYNPADKNAISISIENIDAKVSGNPGLELAGYIRATAAETIREAKPEKLSYNGRLMRLSDSEIIVQLTI